MARRPHLLLVVGPGRSGTSAFSGSVAALGYAVPQPELRTDETNPRGFSESLWAVKFHDELLDKLKMRNYDARPYAWQLTQRAARGQATSDRLREWLAAEFEGHDRVLVKDPRTAWFLGLWKRVCRELDIDLSFVTMLRPPSEVVASALRWYSSHETARLAGWVNVNLRTEKMTREDNRAFVRYSDLLTDGRKVLKQIDKALDLGLDLKDKTAMAQVESFLDPGLRRESQTLAELGAPHVLRDLAERAWDGLNGLPDKDDEGTRAGLDKLRAEYRRTYLDAEQLVHHSILARKDEEMALRPIRAKAERAAAEAAAGSDRPAGSEGPGGSDGHGADDGVLQPGEPVVDRELGGA